MSRAPSRCVLFVSLTLLAACAIAPDGPEAPAYGATGTPQLFDGLGDYHLPVTTSSAEAQRWFDQGMVWLFDFNHDEAVRSFTRAAELDPGCAMAFWGVAYAQGPNYNDPGMSSLRSAAAYDAMQKALAALDTETPTERALVEALKARYVAAPPKERTELDVAFAAAMADVWAQHPSADTGMVYAESMMTLHPWELHTCDGKAARPETDTIIATLARTLELDPNHPGANHLYIHAVESSDDKDRGILAADRLSTLVPEAGHLRHMPSHIYVQTGMWDRSIEQNALAMDCDRRYRVLVPEQGIQNGYSTHNSHMLAFSAMMIGREALARQAANAQWDDLPEQALRDFGPFFDLTMCSKYDVLKRFGRWDELLAEPAPPEFMPITTAVWRAHRAIAFAAKKDIAAATAEHAAYRTAMTAALAAPSWDAADTAEKFLKVSDLFIAGEIALQQGDWEGAAKLLEESATVEDSLGYGEPPSYLQPVRHTLGAVYLKAGRFTDAERVYRADLAKWRGNGWALYGLARALEGQDRLDDARPVRAEFERVWAGADEPIETSCKCIPKT